MYTSFAACIALLVMPVQAEVAAADSLLARLQKRAQSLPDFHLRITNQQTAIDDSLAAAVTCGVSEVISQGGMYSERNSIKSSSAAGLNLESRSSSFPASSGTWVSQNQGSSAGRKHDLTSGPDARYVSRGTWALGAPFGQWAVQSFRAEPMTPWTDMRLSAEVSIEPQADGRIKAILPAGPNAGGQWVIINPNRGDLVDEWVSYDETGRVTDRAIVEESQSVEGHWLPQRIRYAAYAYSAESVRTRVERVIHIDVVQLNPQFAVADFVQQPGNGRAYDLVTRTETSSQIGDAVSRSVERLETSELPRMIDSALAASDAPSAMQPPSVLSTPDSSTSASVQKAEPEAARPIGRPFGWLLAGLVCIVLAILALACFARRHSPCRVHHARGGPFLEPSRPVKDNC